MDDEDKLYRLHWVRIESDSGPLGFLARQRIERAFKLLPERGGDFE